MSSVARRLEYRLQLWPFSPRVHGSLQPIRSIDSRNGTIDKTTRNLCIFRRRRRGNAWRFFTAFRHRAPAKDSTYSHRMGVAMLPTATTTELQLPHRRRPHTLLRKRRLALRHISCVARDCNLNFARHIERFSRAARRPQPSTACQFTWMRWRGPWSTTSPERSTRRSMRIRRISRALRRPA
jgi:hypothetical protein